jgi:hypothetical protein
LAYLYWQSGNTEKAFQTADKINKFDGDNSQTTIFSHILSYYKQYRIREMKRQELVLRPIIIPTTNLKSRQVVEINF